MADGQAFHRLYGNVAGASLLERQLSIPRDYVTRPAATKVNDPMMVVIADHHFVSIDERGPAGLMQAR
jgi:hypothetical protein